MEKILQSIKNINYDDIATIEEIIILLDDYVFKLEKIKAELETYIYEPNEEDWEYVKQIIDSLL